MVENIFLSPALCWHADIVTTLCNHSVKLAAPWGEYLTICFVMEEAETQRAGGQSSAFGKPHSLFWFNVGWSQAP